MSAHDDMAPAPWLAANAEVLTALRRGEKGPEAKFPPWQKGEGAAPEGAKPTNPKDVVGSKKLALSVLPWRTLIGPALAMTEGALKYGRHNYRAAGVRASVYFDAVGRHMMEWWEGSDIDADSGLHHIDKAISGLLVLRDSMLEGNLADDRPPSDGAIAGHLARANRQTADLQSRQRGEQPKHHTIGDRKETDRG